LSLALGSAQVTSAPQSPAEFSTIKSSGKPDIVGLSVSRTVTVKKLLDEFPELSKAVYVTIVEPTEKTLPGLWSTSRVKEPQFSETMGSVQLAAALQVPLAVSTDKSIGMPEMIGSSVSITVIVNDTDVELPASSVAV